MKPSRIFISAADPRNVVLADWAASLASVEWLMILACLYALPTDSRPSFHFVLISLIAITTLMFAGWRGIISGHVKLIGSLVLFATNLFFVLFFLTWTFWNYFKYANGWTPGL